MRTVELCAENERLRADRDRWRRYAGMLRDRLAAAQDAVRKWHHHAYCRDYAQDRLAELARRTEAEGKSLRDRWQVAAEKAAEELGGAHAERDALRKQLTECREANEARGNLLVANREIRRQALVYETDIASMQSALVAAGHEPGCPVVHAASVDCVRNSDCIDWRARAERAEAEAGVLRAALERVISLGHNDDCILCGFKDRTADTALSTGAGEKAAELLEAATDLARALRTLSPDEFEQVEAKLLNAILETVAAMEKGHGC